MKIDKNIDIPEYKNTTYPFGELEIGDSFLVDTVTKTSQFSSFVSYARLKTGKKFVTRAVEGGVRVWRTE